MKKYDYILAGSGLYAGVFAYQARKLGKTCLVVEKRDHIGGNIYCEENRRHSSTQIRGTYFPYQ